jgi:chaperonin cofactor prefoldin
MLEELKKKIDDLKTEINTIKNSTPNLKLNIQQLNNDFVFISNLLNNK